MKAAKWVLKYQGHISRGFGMGHRVTGLAVVLAIATASFSFAQATPTATKVEKAKPGMAHETVVQRINSASTLKTFADLLKTAGMDAELGGTGEYTVFAPNDAAFAKIPADTLNALKQDKARLTEILKAHIVSGKRIGMRDLANMKGQTIKTESGSELSITEVGGRLMIGHAGLGGTNIPASNGAIHEIDTVLMPGMTTGTTSMIKAAPSTKSTEKKMKQRATNAAKAAPEGTK
jgi:transforming growth factor-beta-induced protein